jgi:hypothetical protein
VARPGVDLEGEHPEAGVQDHEIDLALARPAAAEREHLAAVITEELKNSSGSWLASSEKTRFSASDACASPSCGG